MSRELRAAIFDLDGLAVDSEPLHVAAWREAVEEAGRPFETGWIEPYYGLPVSVTAEGLAKGLGLDAEGLLSRREAIFERLTAEGIPALPGLADACALLSSAGLRLALVSSGTGSYVRRVLRRLADHEGVRFETAVTRDDVVRPKPDPEPFLRAAERLAVDPSQCAVLEDAPPGIAGAKAAGMLAVAVPGDHTRGLDLGEADAVEPDLLSAARWILDQAQ